MQRMTAAKLKKESHLEAAFVTILKVCGKDLPPYEREHHFHPTKASRFDFAWPDHWVAVEIDGGQRAPGGGRHNSDKDRDKINSAAALGWRVLRFSGEQIRNDPVGCIEVLRDALNNKNGGKK